MKFSLINIVSGRSRHLHNMLMGIEKSSLIPDEIVIVGMNDEFDPENFPKLPIIFKKMATEADNLPVGSARNEGASIAKNDKLVFLDVDCIPEISFFENIVGALAKNGGCIMGTPKYMTQPVKNDLQNLEKDAIPHPARPQVEEVCLWQDYNLLWSLCFAIDKKDFIKVGGFDEAYTGYGAEDTDLAYLLREKNIPFYLSPAKVYHQQHPVHSPPLNHFEAILNNCRVFYEKWGVWAMDNWLQEFKERGYIEWSKENSAITINSFPDTEAVASVYRPTAPFM